MGIAHNRVYLENHPWIDYYEETPTGTLFTPKIEMKHMTLDVKITKQGATFSEVLEGLSNGKETNNR